MISTAWQPFFETLPAGIASRTLSKRQFDIMMMLLYTLARLSLQNLHPSDGLPQ
jgi:hypothetical protein